MDREDKDTVLLFNLNLPLDRWWRQKHKIAFNSSAHREISVIDQYFEYIEDFLVQQQRLNKYDQVQIEKKFQEEGLFKKLEITEEMTKEMFEELDLDSLLPQDKKDGQ